ncbi:hypothetical protein LINPERHAP1_LOCUS30625, partial [Linum perenne]
MLYMLLLIFCTKYPFVVRLPLWSQIRGLLELSLCIFRLWHRSRDDKESIGPNGSQIGARMREKRTKQNCGLC